MGLVMSKKTTKVIYDAENQSVRSKDNKVAVYPAVDEFLGASGVSIYINSIGIYVPADRIGEVIEALKIARDKL